MIAGQACAGSLVLPCSTLAGEVVSLQFVPTDGKKLFLPGCKLPPDACLIVGGPFREGHPIYIAEGIGQAWSAHQATRAPAVCCFGVARMASVTKALRERYPGARLVVVSDSGKENQCAAIAKEVSGAWVELPAGSPQNFDLNDLHQANDSKDMGEAIAAAKAIHAAVGGVVLVVHHTGKDAARGMRGHSSLIAALDAAIEVSRDVDRREWKIAKSKDGSDGEAHQFRLEVVTIGKDEDDGEPVTSCVVVPENDAGEDVRRVKLPSGGNQRIIWDGLQELLKAAGDRRPAGVPEELPMGRPVLQVDEAIVKVRSRLAVESDRQTERTRQAITGLVTRGLLVLREGWLWVS
jgi:hypothetical protein